MTNLEILNIESILSFTTNLGNLSNLKQLCCCKCDYYEKGSHENLLQSAVNLNYLDIRNSLVENSIINIAIEETNKRRNNTTLKILIKNTNEDIEKIEKKH